MSKSNIIKEFLVGLGFDIDEAGMQKFSSGIASATIKAAALGAACIAGAAAVTAFVTKIASELDDLSDLGIKVNADAEAIDRLGYAASLNDSSLAAVSSSLAGLAKNAGDAQMGIGRAKKVFETIGISVVDANGKLKKSSDLMLEIGDRIKGMERGQQIAVLERLGIDSTLIQTLTKDVSGLTAEYDAMMKAAGLNMNDAAQDASDYMDKLEKLKFTIALVGKTIAVKFFKLIGGAFVNLQKIIVENIPLIISTITPIIQTIMSVAGAIMQLAGRALSGIGYIIGLFNKVNAATDGWLGKVALAVAAWKFLNLSFLASPLGIILALIAAVALLVDDFLTFKEGGKSMLDWSNTWVLLGAQVGSVIVAVIAGIWAIGAAWSAMGTVWAGVGMAMAVVTNAALWPIVAVIAAVVALAAAAWLVYKNWDTLKGWFETFTDWLGGVFIGGIVAMSDMFSSVPQKIIAGWATLRTWFTEFISWIGGQFTWLAGKAKEIGAGVLGSIAGGMLSMAGDSMPSPALVPSPATAAGVNQQTQQVLDQKTEINVYGATDPEAAGRAVLGGQKQVNADLCRSMSGVAR